MPLMLLWCTSHKQSIFSSENAYITGVGNLIQKKTSTLLFSWVHCHLVRVHWTKLARLIHNAPDATGSGFLFFSALWRDALFSLHPSRLDDNGIALQGARVQAVFSVWKLCHWNYVCICDIAFIGLNMCVMGVMKIGNIVPRVGIEPTSLAFGPVCYPLHHVDFPNVTTIPTPTCLCISLPQRSVWTTELIPLEL